MARKKSSLKIKARYASVDGVVISRNFATRKGLAKFVNEWLGTNPNLDRAHGYDVAFDGVGTVTWSIEDSDKRPKLRASVRFYDDVDELVGTVMKFYRDEDDINDIRDWADDEVKNSKITLAKYYEIVR